MYKKLDEIKESLLLLSADDVFFYKISQNSIHNIKYYFQIKNIIK